MKRRIAFLLCLLLLMSLVLSGCGGNDTAYDQGSIAFLDNVSNDAQNGYVVLWQERATTYKRLTSAVNVLAPTWLYVSQNENETVLLDTTQMGDSVDYAGYVQQANKDQIQVWAGVVCQDEAQTDAVLTQDDVNDAFVTKISEFVQASGVNGVNLYFPALNSENRDAFSALVFKVRTALAEGVMLNVCVSFASGGTAETQSSAYDYVTLADTCDHLLLMAFEQYGLFSETAGPICGYEWLSSNAAKMLTMVPSSKMVLILPFYGRDFRFNESGEALWLSDPAQGPVVSYVQIEELYLQNQYYDSNEQLITSAETLVGEMWDETYHTAYTKFTDTNGVMHVIWYDNAQSMTDKASIAIEYGFAGVGAYENAYSDATLWKGVRAAMDGGYLPARMMQMLRLYTYDLKVYDPQDKRWAKADDTATNRLMNLLSVARVAASSGIDTGYILRGTLRTSEDEKGYEISWIVKEKNGRYLLVPENEYTSIITSGQSLWLPSGVTPQMLEDICLVKQPSAS